jgi:hypothetical protein
LGASQTGNTNRIFLEDAMPSAVRAATIAISERVYRDTSDWYLPSYQIDVNEAQRHQIQRVLNAFTFGNPQLLTASRLCPAVAIGEREVRDLWDNPEDFERIQQTVQMFKDVLPELTVQDALFHMSIKIFNDAAPNNRYSTEYCLLLHRFYCLFSRSSPSTVLEEVYFASILV